MKKEGLYFTVDPQDYPGMIAIMDEYGDSDTMYLGTNEHLEDVAISVFKEKISVTTYQANGWIRTNIYWRDRTREELYEGRWDT